MGFLKNDYEKRENAITPEEYEQIRKEASNFLKGENNPNYGNHALAGENNPYYRKKHSEEILQRIRERVKGKMVGEKNSMYGKKQSEEARAKMREASKRRWSKIEEHQRAKANQESKKRKIVQYNLNNEIVGIWSFAGTASKAVGVSKSNITNACHRKVTISGGYKWKLLDDVKKEFFIKKLKKYDKEWKE